MKIIISGGWSYGNVGDEVIADSTIYLFDKFFPGEDISYTSFDVGDFVSTHGITSKESVHAILEKKSVEINDIQKIIDSPQNYKLDEFVNSIDNDTLFVMSGGGYFTEHWKSQFIARIVEIELAKKYGAKIAIIGQSIGPVYSKEKLTILRHAMALCDFISVRDVSTHEFLSSLELPFAVHYYPDLAFVISDIIPGVNKQDVIGFMPAAYSSYTDIKTGTKNPFVEKIKKRISFGAINYKKEYRKLIKDISDNFRVSFIMSTAWEWDFEFVRWLCKGIPSDRVSIIECKNTREICESISSLKYLVSTKMHPLIIASTYGEKIIGVSYNFKVTDFMKMIGRETNCYNVDNLDASKMKSQIVKDLEVDSGVMDCQTFKSQVYQMMEKLVVSLKNKF